MKRHKSILLAVALLTAVGITGCADDDKSTANDSKAAGASEGDTAWQEIVKKANEEGEVTMYDTHLQPQLDAFTAAFEKAYPDIKLNAVRLIATESVPKVEAERTSGADGADVLTTADESFGISQSAAGSDRLATLAGPDVAKLSDDVVKGDGKWAITSFNVLMLGWNTDVVKDPPKTYEDLLKPEFKGKIGLPDNINVATTTYYNTLTDETSPDFLTKLAAQDPTIYDSGQPLGQGIASGEVGVTPYATPVTFEDLKSQGAPVSYAPPEGEKMWGVPFPVYVLGWAKHPNAAQVLANFMFSPAGQEAFAANGVGVISPAPKSALADLANVTPADTSGITQEQGDAAIAQWKQTFGR